MYYAYYIGGSMDLTKRAHQEDRPPRTITVDVVGKFSFDGGIKIDKQIYVLTSPCRFVRDCYVFEYDGA
jgi:hypothetical protein